jgi:hypothetical protein
MHRGFCAMLLGIALGACTPALNWREVQLGQLRSLLPCKPDTAMRPVTLADIKVNLEVAGCEAGDALFAVSRIQAGDAAQAPQLMAAWRQASLAQIQMRAVHPVADSGDASSSFDLLADGNRTDGSALQARFKWLQRGNEVYQLAVYATHLLPEQTQPLLSEAQLR